MLTNTEKLLNSTAKDREGGVPKVGGVSSEAPASMKIMFTLNFSVQITCNLNHLKLDNLKLRKSYIKVAGKTFYNVISKI